ncbi:hypothetical protein HFV04_025160 [Pseudomonas sp. BIGb0427]|uniref:hypothetical protein n=1 Tax=unclassified Pseudomonas TaxID=196821 RepID=UPI0018A778AA|nr:MULTISPECIES: hypothetical protein [unclassified Pseudomonas]QPG62764.1 hypothetical protein HFV04_025160 [Pseudomonas sp. BIGb0427]UVM65169.1 hypothetical protein LOY34_17745 [Pseudomonas sp. B21-009]
MQIEKTYEYAGPHGIVFHVSKFVVTEGDRGQLRELHFPEAKNGNYEVVQRTVAIYDRMQARSRACTMTIRISRPLTRVQGDILNEQRHKISNASSSSASRIAMLAGPAFTIPVAILTRFFVSGSLRTYHTGDLIISIEARVDGGIGPQFSTDSIIIPTAGLAP